MKFAFADNSGRLFGREPDLEYLLERSRHRGVTAVAGRAQMGKSWLLTELARRLSLEGRAAVPQVIELPPPLVGYAESLGETADLLLREVVDLYSRWLSDSSYWEQAQVIVQQHKADLIGRTGETVGSLLEKLSKLGGKPIEAVGGIVKDAFEGLASANRDLMSGSLQLPRLQIEQGRDLLQIVYKVTGRPLALIFGQWEKSPGDRDRSQYPR